ncbi:MAG TPA: MFS transporter [Streptosporangiaceae bacterium]
MMMTSPQTPLTVGKPEHRWWILAVLATAQLMVALDATVVSIALPHAQASLHFSSADRQWIITAYALAFGSLLLLGGRLADIYGRKRLFLAGAAGFAAASAAGGASQSFAMLVTARAAQGAFGAVLAPAALSLLTTTFSHPDERGKAFGIYGGIATAGASVGLLAGGALTQYLNWRWTMFINVPIAGIVITGGVVFLSSRLTQARQRVDRAGAVLGGLGLFAVVYGFAHAATKPGSAGWADPQTIGSIAAGIVLLAAFVIAERRVAYPLLPLRVVLDRNRGGAYSAMLLASIGLFSVFLFLTYYLETIQGYSPVRTGLAFLPLTVTLLVSAGVSNTVLLPRVSPRLLVPAGLLLAAAGMALMTKIGLHSSYASPVLPSLLLIGLGLGMVFAPCYSLGTSGVTDDDAGVASATINVSQQIGASIGTALLNSIATGAAASFITAHATGAAPSRVLLAQAAVHSYTIAFWAGAAILTAAALALAPLLRPGLAELGVMPRSDIRPRGVTTDRHTQPVRSVSARPPSGHKQHLDPKAPCQSPGSSVDRSAAEIATDGAPGCAELKGAS